MSGRDRDAKIRLRRRVGETVAGLQRLDDDLAELAESLSLPLDADEMWEARLPESFEAHLYAAIDAVRTDCLQDAVNTLLAALRQNEVSLRQRFLRAESKRGGISFLHKKTGNDAARKETPPC
jgi:primosomal protein N''